MSPSTPHQSAAALAVAAALAARGRGSPARRSRAARASGTGADGARSATSTSRSTGRGSSATRGARGTSPSWPDSTCSARARPPTTATWCDAEQTARGARSALRTATERARRPACWPRASWPSTGSPRRSRSAERLLAADTTSVAARGDGGRDRARAGRLRARPARLFGMLATYPGRARRRAAAGALGGASRPARGGAAAPARGARRRPTARHGMPREQLAWFHLRLGDLALRAGQLRRGRGASSTRGSRSCPATTGCWARMARLAAARHDWRRRRSTTVSSPLARALDPATLGLLSRRVRRARATAPRPSEYSRAMAVAVLQPARALTTARGACSCSTTTARCRACSASVRDELRTRRDIYG